MSLTRNEIVKLVSQKREIIKAKTENNVVNTDQFNQLISILAQFSKQVQVPTFALHFHEAEILNLDFDQVKKNLSGQFSTMIGQYNFFLVDRGFNVESAELYNPADSIDAKETYKTLSVNKHCIILMFDGQFYFYFDGIELTSSVFAAEADFKKFASKKDISKLFEVLQDYKQHIKDRSIYCKFFTEKANIKRLKEEKKLNVSNNLLRNKPEGILRDDLRNFLQERISRTFNFSRESLLDTNNRLDINTEDELGNYYFLEIKWVGKSINSTTSGYGIEFDETRPQAGLIQTYGYIAELNAMKKTVKVGCLVVFDARDVKTTFSYDYTKVEPEWRKYDHLYKCVDDLHLENTSPL